MKLCIESLERRALLAGELDTTFGTGGVATADFDAFSEQLTEVAAGPNGTIVAAGFLGGSYLVARYTSTGQLDTTFNGTGFVKTAITNFPASALAISPAGKIYVGGTQYVSSGVDRAAIFAFNANGTPDTTFDSDGVWTGTWTGSSSGNTVVGLQYLNDRLYAGVGSGTKGGVARFTPAGALDTAFGTAGTGIAMSVQTTTLVDFAITPLYASGPIQLYIGGQSGSGAFVTRFNLDGTQDMGNSVFSLYSGPFTVTHMAVDASGSVFFGGNSAGGATVARVLTAANATAFSTYTTAEGGLRNVTSLTTLRTGGVFFTGTDATFGASKADVATTLTSAGTVNQSFGSGGRFALPTANVGNATTRNNGAIVLVGRQSLANDRVDGEIVALNDLPSPTQISGYLFDDVNGDGKQNDNGGRSEFYGITAYLDQNNNGVFDSATEPSAYAGNGKFVFENVAPGTYNVRLHVYENIPATQTYPVNKGGFLVTTSGPFNSVGPFGVRFAPATSAVSGTVFNDADADGVLDAGEAGLASEIVFVDADGDTVLDSNETRVTTDSAGAFTINLPAGNHRLRHTASNGYRPNGQSLAVAVSGSTFSTNSILRVPTDTAGNQVRFAARAGARVQMAAFEDLDGDGFKDVEEQVAMSGGFFYADLNGNSIFDGADIRGTPTGTGYETMELLPGTYVIRQSLDSGWVSTTGSDTLVIKPTTAEANLLQGRRRASPAVTAKLSGFLFNDNNTNGKFDANDTRTSSGKQVFLDLDSDSQLDNNEVVTTTNASGEWSFPNLPAGVYHVRRIFPSGYVGTTPPIDVTLAAGQTIANLSIGSKPGSVVPPPPPAVNGKLSGFLFNDNNTNGKYDGGDTKTSSGKQVFLDLDGDDQLDAGERVTTTNANGEWSFADVPAGTYHVRRVFPSGYVGTTAPIDVVLSAGQTISNLSIGSKPGSVVPPPPPPPPANTATIKGRAFSDTNGNGKVDSGELYTPDKPVFLDTDDDGIRDANETLISTDKDGYFTFTNLAPGTYRIRRVFVTGYTYSTPKLNVTVTAGQTVSGLLVGTKKI